MKDSRKWEIVARIRPDGMSIISAFGKIGRKDYAEVIRSFGEHVDGARLHGASHTMTILRDRCGVWHSHRQHIWGDLTA